MLLINTHTHSQSKCWGLQPDTCTTPSVRVLPCEDSAGMIDVSQTIRAAASQRLRHHQHLLFTGPSVHRATVPPRAEAGSPNALGYVLKATVSPWTHLAAVQHTCGRTKEPACFRLPFLIFRKVWKLQKKRLQSRFSTLWVRTKVKRKDVTNSVAYQYGVC